VRLWGRATGERAVILVALTAACSRTTRPTFDYESQVGVVTAQDSGAHCLTVRAPSLRPGTQLTLADPSDSAAVIGAAVTGRVDSRCPNQVPNPDDRFYAVRVDSPTAALPGHVWFAFVLGDSVLAATARGVEGDIDGDGTREQLRVCTSSEGLHLTIWSGEPLVGPRRWHRYVYLGYDVEPSCVPKDYEGT
jgi:hypothetical protein